MKIASYRIPGDSLFCAAATQAEVEPGFFTASFGEELRFAPSISIQLKQVGDTDQDNGKPQKNNKQDEGPELMHIILLH